MLLMLAHGLITSYPLGHTHLLCLTYMPVIRDLIYLTTLLYSFLFIWLFFLQLLYLLLYLLPVLLLLKLICLEYISADDIDYNGQEVSSHLPHFPTDISNCSKPNCSAHLDHLDSFAHSFLSCIFSSSLKTLPSISHSSSSASSPRLPGWNESTKKLKNKSIFWHKIWVQAGCPSSGVLSSVKCFAKRRFKYAVRCLKRRKEFIVRKKFISSFSSRNKDQFWKQVKQYNHVKRRVSPCVDGVSDDRNIASLFSSQIQRVLNKDKHT